MIKLTFVLRRLPSLSRSEFQDYWFNSHAPLVASVRDVLRIQRYVQMHSLPDDMAEPVRAARGAPRPYDGVAQLWWANLDDLGAGTGEPAAQAAGRLLLEDEKKFIDLENSPLWFGEERVIF